MTTDRIDALCGLIGFGVAHGAEVERRLAQAADSEATPGPQDVRA